jgi:hypothetical protein
VLRPARHSGSGEPHHADRDREDQGAGEITAEDQGDE